MIFNRNKGLHYRVGQKVGMLSFDVKTNRDRIESGVIVARKLTPTFLPNKIRYEAKYCIKKHDGRFAIVEHDAIWTDFLEDKNVKEEK